MKCGFRLSYRKKNYGDKVLFPFPQWATRTEKDNET